MGSCPCIKLVSNISGPDPLNFSGIGSIQDKTQNVSDTLPDLCKITWVRLPVLTWDGEMGLTSFKLGTAIS